MMGSPVAITAIVIQWITSKDCGKARQVGARPPGRTRSTPLPRRQSQPSLPPAFVGSFRMTPYDSRSMIETSGGLPVVSGLGTLGGNTHELVCSRDTPRSNRKYLSTLYLLTKSREPREGRRTDLDNKPSEETLPREPETPSSPPDWDKGRPY